MTTFTKYIRSENKRDIDREYETQLIASKYGFAPKIYEYSVTHISNKNYYEGKLVMEHLNEMCIADMYGDESKHIPSLIWVEMRNILKILYEKEGIEYIDITGYNCIEKKGKVYIIDFELCGLEGVDRYPSFLNHDCIIWPKGAEDAKSLRCKHDLEFAKRLMISSRH